MLGTQFATFQATQPPLKNLITQGKQPEVKFPLLYQVSKDGITHYLLGHDHSIPLSYMPSYVRETIEKCHLLLSEVDFSLQGDTSLGYTSLITENFYKNLTFQSFLEPQNVEKFKEEILPILQLRGIQEENFDNISAILLYKLFLETIQRREEAKALCIDDGLVALFQDNNKDIHYLNPQKYLDFMQYCLPAEKSLQEKCDQDPEDEDLSYLINEVKETLKNLAAEINDYYNYPHKRCKEDSNSKRILDYFMNTDLHISPIKNEKDELSSEQLNIILEENKVWVDTFEHLHTTGKEGILLACGAAHLAHSQVIEAQGSLIALLEKRGFVVTKVVDECTQTLTNRFATLSVK